MIKINFFDREYRLEPVKQDAILGLCDPEGEQPAYSTKDIDCGDKWCATVKNNDRKGIQFIAIDKNIDIRRPDGNLENRCDGMIYVEETRELSFVELKDYRVGGLSTAEGQLLITIQYFLANHNYADFHNRRAYACRPSHPHFMFSARQSIQEFYNKTHFRLMPQATIDI